MAERIYFVLQENQQRYPGMRGQIKVYGQDIYFHLVIGFWAYTHVTRTSRFWDTDSFSEKKSTDYAARDVFILRQSDAGSPGSFKVTAHLDPPEEYIYDVLISSLEIVGPRPIITLKCKPIFNLGYRSMANVVADGKVQAAFLPRMVGISAGPDLSYQGQITSQNFDELLQQVRSLDKASQPISEITDEPNIVLRAAIIDTSPTLTGSIYEVRSTVPYTRAFKEIVRSLENWYNAAQPDPKRPSD